MAIFPLAGSLADSALVDRARQGESAALGELLDRHRRPLLAYVYRMTAHWDDAQDLVQDVQVRALESLPRFRGEAKFQTWLFGIATHVCLDHLRRKTRWPLEAQIEGERETVSSDEKSAGLKALISQPDFIFEIREHIAFCFTCIARSLEPEAQAALVVREVLGFSNEESAAILGVSEPVFRHRLSGARRHMAESYEGLCALINKQGVCHQCKGLREWTGEANRGADLVEIQVAPGKALTVDNLLDARIAIARASDLEEGKSAPMHRAFYKDIERRESQR